MQGAAGQNLPIACLASFMGGCKSLSRYACNARCAYPALAAHGLYQRERVPDGVFP